MPSLITNAQFVLIFLSAVGFYATWYILLKNGTTDYMSEIRDFGPRLLPGTKEPLKTVYVGIPAVDYQLTVLTLFFWEQVDGSDPNNSLFCFHFATQVACGWGLLLIEGHRNSNRWSIVSFIGIWGVFVQNAAYAVVLPIYLIIHLSMSKTVSPNPSGLSVSLPLLQAIPMALAIGYVLPAVLMSLPAPSIISFQRKQMYVAIWQMFPVWVSLVHEGLTHMLRTLIYRETSKQPSDLPHSMSMDALRILYIGLLIIAGIGQIATATMMATSTFFPDLFSTNFQGIFKASKVFLPAAVSPASKMPSIGSGAHMLLQYDEAIGSLAMIIWSTVLFVDVNKKTRAPQKAVYQIAQAVTVFILTGPLGYATACIWARDEVVWADQMEPIRGEESLDVKKTS